MEFDIIGYWSEVKLDIISKYASAYSKIMAAQPRLAHSYIDGFAGAGEHISKYDGRMIPGSPLNALSIDPPFRHHYLVDLNSGKVDYLRNLIGNRADVQIY